MLVSINWIKDYVDLDGCDIKGLINKFTLATAEVEDIYYMGRDVQNVVVGEIKTLENHPESKKLHLLTVDIGDKTVNCVCGAPNVRVGQKVAFATAGAESSRAKSARQWSRDMNPRVCAAPRKSSASATRTPA